MAKQKQGKGKGVSRSLTEQARYDVSVPEELLKRARRDLARESYVTPFKVSQRYNVTISTARKVLRMLEEEGTLVLFTPNRRSPVYVPKDKLPTAPRGL
ncbi:MAG: 30S ribosomal protein S25e [Desulfurococcales archaeon]|nr:30S ribosomal protein S25e [Desulfurococcales archaeon]